MNEERLNSKFKSVIFDWCWLLYFILGYIWNIILLNILIKIELYVLLLVKGFENCIYIIIRYKFFSFVLWFFFVIVYFNKDIGNYWNWKLIR